MRHWLPVLAVLASGGFRAQNLPAQDGAALYQAHCAICHEDPEEEGAPGRDVFRQMDPEQILNALERGVMRGQGSDRSRAERRALAEFLTGKTAGADAQIRLPNSAYCSGTTAASSPAAASPRWNGWGVTVTNTRFQPASAAGLSAREVPYLQLKWAFGFPGASSASSQPVVWGDRLYIGSWEGDVYSLDAKSGCIYWMMEAEAGIRSAISLEQRPGEGLRAYFGDLAANVYAVDALTGKQIWKTKVDEFAFARITGSPTLFAGRLYVPVSSREESQVSDARYPCCRFRGSVVALDAESGQQIWKTYVIPEEAKPTHKNRRGTQIWGPAGGAVWVAPTIDARRGVLYVGTGNDYSPPSTQFSDAILALDLETGAVRWARQMVQGDIWNGSCRGGADPATCPDPEAPDFDFPASPILVDIVGGKQLLIASQKSGLLYALDPDQNGRTVWQQRIAKGGTQGGVMFGPAADERNLYAAISDYERLGGGREPNPNAGGGMVAVELATGKVLWRTPAPPCGDRKPCSPAQAAAVTAIPGVVFSGSVDGRMRAYSAADGRILWEYDTVREFPTVNGVAARGGSINNGGPAVAGGMLYFNSGYSHHSGIIPGNVLLAFSTD
ncbi:MAG TPA: PQQ-binding-like beta-propeller repeat protein [Terriglobia bacterium]|nr:PQQ-binding-like beta-propeller repeat protein [Terriglobia bacterium]